MPTRENICSILHRFYAEYSNLWSLNHIYIYFFFFSFKSHIKSSSRNRVKRIRVSGNIAVVTMAAQNQRLLMNYKKFKCGPIHDTLIFNTIYITKPWSDLFNKKKKLDFSTDHMSGEDNRSLLHLHHFHDLVTADTRPRRAELNPTLPEVDGLIRWQT